MRFTNTTFRKLALLSLLSLAGCSSTVDGKRTESLSSPQKNSTAEIRTSSKVDALEKAKLRVSYSLLQDHITLHEPVILNFAIENDTSVTLLVNLGANRKEVFAFTIRKPDGSNVELPPKRAEGSSMIGRVSLQPAQDFKQKLLLNEWFDFAKPGQYEIAVRLVKPEVTPRGFNIYDISDTPEFRITLDVQPRDPARLKELCVQLKDQIIKAVTVDEATEPAEALSYVNDPIAVPYLAEVLKSDRLLEAYAISGLERIGTDEAIKALEVASRSRNRDVALMAKRALERLGKSSRPRAR
jgi:hypothetical protein